MFLEARPAGSRRRPADVTKAGRTGHAWMLQRGKREEEFNCGSIRRRSGGIGKRGSGFCIGAGRRGRAIRWRHGRWIGCWIIRAGWFVCCRIHGRMARSLSPVARRCASSLGARLSAWMIRRMPRMRICALRSGYLHDARLRPEDGTTARQARLRAGDGTTGRAVFVGSGGSRCWRPIRGRRGGFRVI